MFWTPDSDREGAYVTTNALKAHAYIDQHFDEHLGRIQQFVRMPTVSTEGIGIIDGAYWLTRTLRAIGFTEAELVDVGGPNPGVWAALETGARKSIVSYGFFDTRPVGHRPWTYQPFGGVIVKDPKQGRMLVGRGAGSPKGPLVAWLNALEAMIKTGTLPVNVMLLIEGDEIEGSPDFGAMFRRYRDHLKSADACFAGGMTQSPSGEVSVNLGYRGLLYLELTVSGERWRHGPIGMSAHSSLKNCVHSPASRLAHAISSLTDETGAMIRVPGIQDSASPTEGDLALMNALMARFDDAGIKTALGLGGFEHVAGNAAGRDLLLRYLYAPSLNVNGLSAGYHGPAARSSRSPNTPPLGSISVSRRALPASMQSPACVATWTRVATATSRFGCSRRRTGARHPSTRRSSRLSLATIDREDSIRWSGRIREVAAPGRSSRASLGFPSSVRLVSVAGAVGIVVMNIS